MMILVLMFLFLVEWFMVFRRFFFVGILKRKVCLVLNFMFLF